VGSSGLRIGLVIHELLTSGGTERQCLSLARELRKQGNEVTVITTAYDPERCYPGLAADLVVRIAGPGWFPRLRRPLLLRRLLDMYRLSQVVLADQATLQYDILNAHHWPPHWAAVWAKRRVPHPVVWACNDLPSAWLNQVRGVWGALRRLAYRPVHRFDYSLVRRVDRITVLDQRMAELVAHSYHGATVKVIRTGIDLEKFAAIPTDLPIRSRHGLRRDSYLLLCLGILMPHRRIEDVIEAVKLLRDQNLDTQLLIAGSTEIDPAYTRILRKLVGRLQLSNNVHLIGGISEAQIADYYRACDAFVFPNEEQTWGLAVIEAMAVGKPVIVSTGSGVHEVIQDGVTGFLIPSRSPSSIATIVRHLADHPAIAAGVAEAGRTYVVANFSWGRYAEDMLSVFAELLDAGDGGRSEGRSQADGQTTGSQIANRRSSSGSSPES